MDTSTQAITTDSLGRRGGPRRRRSESEKRKIVEETLQPGASVAVVARRHEINANSLFAWRRLYQKGLLGSPPAVPQVSLLPVQISPLKRPGRPSKATTTGYLEVELQGVGVVRAHGDLAQALMREIVRALLRR